MKDGCGRLLSPDLPACGTVTLGGFTLLCDSCREVVVRCNCAHVLPTMPTCRGTHMPWCASAASASSGR